MEEAGQWRPPANVGAQAAYARLRQIRFAPQPDTSNRAPRPPSCQSALANCSASAGIAANWMQRCRAPASNSQQAQIGDVTAMTSRPMTGRDGANHSLAFRDWRRRPPQELFLSRLRYVSTGYQLKNLPPVSLEKYQASPPANVIQFTSPHQWLRIFVHQPRLQR